VLLVGLLGYGVGTLLLGLSTAYVTSCLALFFTGCFAGNTVVAKGMIGEIGKDDKGRALGYSAYGVVRSAPTFLSQGFF
jgi:MFS family permease